MCVDVQQVSATPGVNEQDMLLLLLLLLLKLYLKVSLLYSATDQRLNVPQKTLIA